MKRDAGRLSSLVLSRSSHPERRQYCVQKFLGSGHSADVFQAVVLGENSKGRKIALKRLKERKEVRLCHWILKASVTADLDAQGILEVWLQSPLHHPNVVEFQGSFKFEGFTLVVLDLYENKTLKDMLKARGYLTEPETRRFTIQLAGAVKYLHSRGVVHRDLKPGNIGLDTNMNIKIGDFGLAGRLYSPEDRKFERYGTSGYMAPEVFGLDGDGYDQRVDLWSLGVIMSVYQTWRLAPTLC